MIDWIRVEIEMFVWLMERRKYIGVISTMMDLENT